MKALLIASMSDGEFITGSAIVEDAGRASEFWLEDGQLIGEDSIGIAEKIETSSRPVIEVEIRDVDALARWLNRPFADVQAEIDRGITEARLPGEMSAFDKMRAARQAERDAVDQRERDREAAVAQARAGSEAPVVDGRTKAAEDVAKRILAKFETARDAAQARQNQPVMNLDRFEGTTRELAILTGTAGFGIGKPGAQDKTALVSAGGFVGAMTVERLLAAAERNPAAADELRALAASVQVQVANKGKRFKTKIVNYVHIDTMGLTDAERKFLESGGESILGKRHGKWVSAGGYVSFNADPSSENAREGGIEKMLKAVGGDAFKPDRGMPTLAKISHKKSDRPSLGGAPDPTRRREGFYDIGDNRTVNEIPFEMFLTKKSSGGQAGRLNVDFDEFIQDRVAAGRWNRRFATPAMDFVGALNDLYSDAVRGAHDVVGLDIEPDSKDRTNEVRRVDALRADIVQLVDRAKKKRAEVAATTPEALAAQIAAAKAEVAELDAKYAELKELERKFAALVKGQDLKSGVVAAKLDRATKALKRLEDIAGDAKRAAKTADEIKAAQAMEDRAEEIRKEVAAAVSASAKTRFAPAELPDEAAAKKAMRDRLAALEAGQKISHVAKATAAVDPVGRAAGMLKLGWDVEKITAELVRTLRLTPKDAEAAIAAADRDLDRAGGGLTSTSLSVKALSALRRALSEKGIFFKAKQPGLAPEMIFDIETKLGSRLDFNAFQALDAELVKHVGARVRSEDGESQYRGPGIEAIYNYENADIATKFLTDVGWSPKPPSYSLYGRFEPADVKLLVKAWVQNRGNKDLFLRAVRAIKPRSGTMDDPMLKYIAKAMESLDRKFRHDDAKQIIDAFMDAAGDQGKFMHAIKGIVALDNKTSAVQSSGQIWNELRDSVDQGNPQIIFRLEA